jgi:hypothetical protein
MATALEVTAVVYDEINMYPVPADWIKYVFNCNDDDYIKYDESVI